MFNDDDVDVAQPALDMMLSTSLGGTTASQRRVDVMKASLYKFGLQN